MKTPIHSISLLVSVALGVSVLTGCETQMPFSKQTGTAGVLKQMGAIQVYLDCDFSTLRSAQAKISDIDHVTFALQMAGVETQSQTLTKSQLANGTAGVSFSSLPAGSATVSVTVFDATSKVIGSTSGVGVIASGQTTTLNLTVQLVPTYLPALGSLLGNATILDGPTVFYLESISLSLSSSGINPAAPIILSSNGELVLENNDSVSHSITIQDDSDPSHHLFSTVSGTNFGGVGHTLVIDIGNPTPGINFQLSPGNYHILDEYGGSVPLTIVPIS